MVLLINRFVVIKMTSVYYCEKVKSWGRGVNSNPSEEIGGWGGKVIFKSTKPFRKCLPGLAFKGVQFSQIVLTSYCDAMSQKKSILGHLDKTVFIFETYQDQTEFLMWLGKHLIDFKKSGWMGKLVIQHQCKEDQSHLLLMLKNPEKETNWELYCTYLFKIFSILPFGLKFQSLLIISHKTQPTTTDSKVSKIL